MRLNQHNSNFFKGSFTSQSNDWQLKLSIPFDSILQARAAEAFIKKMNSRKFIVRLIENHQWFALKFSV